MEPSPTYIIYSPPYNERRGGSIVLHQLCHALNERGERALVWPMGRLPEDGLVSQLMNRAPTDPFRVLESLSTPVASLRRPGENAIVLYPEIVDGNPLGAENVARWLLNIPGFFTGEAAYGKDELFFKFDDYCDDPRITGGKAERLFLFTLNPCYVNFGGGERSGSCYLMRKGKGKPIVHDLEDSIRIDGRAHEEVAGIFNRTRTFYSYDEATMYSQYAALCGCESVVIPSRYENRADWARDHPLSRYGVAYGLDDIAHTRDTAHLVADHLRALQDDGMRTVGSFVETTRRHFGFGSG